MTGQNIQRLPRSASRRFIHTPHVDILLTRASVASWFGFHGGVRLLVCKAAARDETGQYPQPAQPQFLLLTRQPPLPLSHVSAPLAPDPGRAPVVLVSLDENISSVMAESSDALRADATTPETLGGA